MSWPSCRRIRVKRPIMQTSLGYLVSFGFEFPYHLSFLVLAEFAVPFVLNVLHVSVVVVHIPGVRASVRATVAIMEQAGAEENLFLVRERLSSKHLAELSFIFFLFHSSPWRNRTAVASYEPQCTYVSYQPPALPFAGIEGRLPVFPGCPAKLSENRSLIGKRCHLLW